MIDDVAKARRFVAFFTLASAIACAAGAWLSFRSMRRALRDHQTDQVQANYRILAAQCGAAWGPQFETVCLGGLFYAAQMSEPTAFYSAVVAGNDLRLLLHSDFLKKDFQRRGAILSDIRLGKPASGEQEFVLRQEGQVIFGEPVLSKGKKVGMLIATYNQAALQRSLGGLLDRIEIRLAYVATLALCLLALLAAALARASLMIF